MAREYLGITAGTWFLGGGWILHRGCNSEILDARNSHGYFLHPELGRIRSLLASCCLLRGNMFEQDLCKAICVKGLVLASFVVFTAMSEAGGGPPALPTKILTFADLDGLSKSWDSCERLRGRVVDLGSLVVKKPGADEKETTLEGVIDRTLDEARYNYEVLLPVFQKMKGHCDKIPHLDSLKEEVKALFVKLGRGNPKEKTLLDQSWSVRYLFGVVKHLQWRPEPPRVARLTCEHWCYTVFWGLGG